MVADDWDTSPEIRELALTMRRERELREPSSRRGGRVGRPARDAPAQVSLLEALASRTASRRRRPAVVAGTRNVARFLVRVLVTAQAGSSGASSGEDLAGGALAGRDRSPPRRAKGIRRADVRRARSLRRRVPPGRRRRRSRDQPGPRSSLGPGRGRHRGTRQPPRGGPSQRRAALCLRELEPRHGHVRARPAVCIHRRRRLRGPRSRLDPAARDRPADPTGQPVRRGEGVRRSRCTLLRRGARHVVCLPPDRDRERGGSSEEPTPFRDAC